MQACQRWLCVVPALQILGQRQANVWLPFISFHGMVGHTWLVYGAVGGRGRAGSISSKWPLRSNILCSMFECFVVLMLCFAGGGITPQTMHKESHAHLLTINTYIHVYAYCIFMQYDCQSYFIVVLSRKIYSNYHHTWYACVVTAVAYGYPGNTGPWSNVGLVLGQRRRRWPNFNPALDQCLVFAG